MSAVIFDLDGTLIDATKDIHLCATRMLEAEGLPPLPEETVKSFVGNGLAQLINHCIAAQGLEPTRERHDRMYAEFHRHYETAVHNTTVYPGVFEALDRLKADGYRLALCTNKPETPARAVTAHLGLDRYFDAWAFGDGPYPRKPDAAAARHVIDQLPARRFLFVGDSAVDAGTARNAKLPFALYSEGFRKEPIEQLTHAAVFSDYADLPGIAAKFAPRPE
ncbi:HAD-IA family hydrolase [Psychromarinibacter halotolerans]|uniref:phosphoglycolate phosphatase n=1 Tax=Psychromarinibacter halotolerans TaxID=1775175 RepID=A0ABV7GWY0_9RHOB|nr:HAD-IA family hydrolase [Psychromarinibacter halotolerans]MDF0598144.1 HAD-IA family hydrolase [Psychromarinibacter halotolerans]